MLSNESVSDWDEPGARLNREHSTTPFVFLTGITGWVLMQYRRAVVALQGVWEELAKPPMLSQELVESVRPISTESDGVPFQLLQNVVFPAVSFLPSGSDPVHTSELVTIFPNSWY